MAVAVRSKAGGRGKGRPRWLKDALKRSQDTPKTNLKASPKPPEHTKTGPRESQTPQDSPQRLQDPAQDEPKSSQRRPKAAPRGPENVEDLPNPFCRLTMI